MVVDSRGDIGFAEAMAGTVVVCIVLTVFVSFTCSMVASDSGDSLSVDWSCFEGFGVEDGRLVWYDEGMIEGICSKCQASSIGVFADVKAEGIQYDGPWLSEGYDSDGTASTKLVVVDSDDGRRIPVLLKVVLCA